MSLLSKYFTILLVTLVFSFEFARADAPKAPHILAATHVKAVFLKFMLAATRANSDEEKLTLLHEAESYIQKFTQQTPLVIPVQSRNELSSLQNRYTTLNHDFEVEISALRKRDLPPYFIIKAESFDVEEELNRKLDLLFAAPNSEMTKPGTALNRFLRDSFNSVLFSTSKSELSVKLLPKALQLKIINEFAKKFEKINAELDAVGSRVANSPDIQFPLKSMQVFFQILFDQYFQRLPWSSKQTIMSNLIDNLEVTNDRDLFSILVLNSGPQLQKLLQVYARQDGFNENLKSIFKQLEQNTRATPWAIIQQIIHKQEVPFEWLTIDPKPLGVGTMAQVHRAEILDQEVRKQVVARILKPNVRKKIETDQKILAAIAPQLDQHPTLILENFPKLGGFLGDLETMILNETEIDRTVKNQKTGAIIYNRTLDLTSPDFSGKLQIYVPEVYNLPTAKNIMVQEFVAGKSFESLMVSDPKKAKIIAQELAKIWVKETLLGSGFFHADLHQGNLRYSQNGKDIRLFILDFGMTGTISEKMQNQFLTFAMVSAAKEPKLMSDLLWELSETKNNSLTQKQLESELLLQFSKNQRLGVTWPYYEWISFAANQGLKLPTDFTSLNRGSLLIFRMLEDLGSSMDLATTIKDSLVAQPLRLNRLIRSNEALGYVKFAQLLWKQAQIPTPNEPAPSPFFGLQCRQLFSP